MEGQNPNEPVYNVSPLITSESPPKKNWFSAHMILGIVFLLAVAGAVVAGIYYWQTVRQIPATVALPVHKEKVDPMASWKTYTNSEHGFEFKYPETWTIDSTQPLIQFRSKPLVDGTDLPPNLAVIVHSKISDLDTKKLGVTDLKDFIAKYSAGNDPYLVKVQDTTIGARSATKASVGPNVFGGGDFYYIAMNNDAILEIRSSDPADVQILSTFKFTTPSSAVDTSAWKTYTNTKYGLEFKYPQIYQIDDSLNASLAKDGTQILILLFKSEDEPVNFRIMKIDAKNLNEAFTAFASKNVKSTTTGKINNFDTLTGSFTDKGITDKYIAITDGKSYAGFHTNNGASDNQQILDQILSTFKFTK